MKYMEKSILEELKFKEPLSLICHRLKNPLSIVKSYLESLISGDCGKVNVKQKEYLKDALENLGRLKKQIDEILILEAVEEGKFKLNLKPISFKTLTLEVLNKFSDWVKAANCKIIFEIAKNLPEVLADPEATKEVIENFISNALKYSSPPGKIEISLKVQRKKVVFSCKDNGISIPKEDFKKVFTKFYRSEKAIEIDPSGSGLGLYLNKKIIEESGGNIWFKKNKDFGMTFYFSLPISK